MRVQRLLKVHKTTIFFKSEMWLRVPSLPVDSPLQTSLNKNRFSCFQEARIFGFDPQNLRTFNDP